MRCQGKVYRYLQALGIGIMKTVQEYLNDPRITGDTGLMSGLSGPDFPAVPVTTA